MNNEKYPRYWKINPFGRYQDEDHCWDAWVKNKVVEMGTWDGDKNITGNLTSKYNVEMGTWDGDKNITGNLTSKYKDEMEFNEKTGIKDEREYKLNIKNRYVQIRRFVWTLTKGDILIPYEKGTILGIGTVGDNYWFDEEEKVHCRDVNWTKFELPIDIKNILDIYNVLKENNTIMPLDDIKDKIKNLFRNENPKETIKESISELLDLLSIKHQIIIFGPPGTGKTFQARKSAVNFIENNLKEE